MNENIEIIDSSQMTILADFGFGDEPMENLAHYYLGVLDSKFVVQIKGLTGNIRANLFFEKMNYEEVLKRTADVYAGKLLDVPDVDYFNYFNIEKGQDDILVGINAVFPPTSSKAIVKFFLQNNRRAKLDGLEGGSWRLPMSFETERKMLAEMQNIKEQVINYKA